MFSEIFFLFFKQKTADEMRISDWSSDVCSSDLFAITPEVKDHLWTALGSLADAPVEQRTLTGLAVLVQASGLKRALTPYTLAGPYGRLLDADGEMFGTRDAQAFETAGLVGTPAAPAVLAFLFHPIGRRLDGRAGLILLDQRGPRAPAPVEQRTLTGLAGLVQASGLKRALTPYTLAGPYGRLLDADGEMFGTSDAQAFETEGLVGTPAAPAVLAYLFHRIGRRLDGRPSLIMIDEGWLALDDPLFGRQLKEWLKTLRKKNASVVFATQSLADIEGSAIAPAIIESCPTRLFLANERALEPQIAGIYQRFGLNNRQIEVIASATTKRDYYCQSALGNRL